MNLLLVVLLFASAATPLKNWVEGPVRIILSEVEKKTFAQLRTDNERQHFIAQFWKSRDPRPETRDNEFKTEFERRVEMADTLFGGDIGGDGWQTERGHYYVLLGPPASRAQFKTHGQLRPVELWFYSGKKEYPQLPSFFSLMFYQRDEIGDYRHYSPFIDGPQSLVKATIRGAADAYRILSNINPDLARASLSLIPGEPVDTTSFAPSMTSDAILAQINQIPKREFERIGLLREMVDVKLRFGGTTSMTAYPFMTGPDTFTVDFAIDRPEGLGNAKVETVVSRNGKEEGRTRGAFAKDEPLIGRLVLRPGDYVVESTIADAAGTQSFVAREAIHLQAAPALALSEVLFFRSATPAPSAAALPFVHSGYRFVPETRKQFTPIDRLQVLFQIAGVRQPPAQADQKPMLKIDYTIAGVSNPAGRWTFHDDVAMDRFDAGGQLLNSRTMSIRELPPGRYFLIIMATDPAGRRASQTVSFEVSNPS